jgi:hypothetical protein
MPYEDELRQLAPLETFDPAAFVGDESTPQHVCDFVLALAAVYNDFRDLHMGRVLLEEVRPPEARPAHPLPSRPAGQTLALDWALHRLIFGVVHELMELIRENREAIAHPAFRKIEETIGGEPTRAWRAVKQAVEERKSSELAKVLVKIRNKVTFHYDAEQIGKAYRADFVATGKKPYVSRGATMRQTRFYFADGATSRYLRNLGLPAEFSKLIVQVNAALHAIVLAFPAARGFGWREAPPRADRTPLA